MIAFASRSPRWHHASDRKRPPDNCRARFAGRAISDDGLQRLAYTVDTSITRGTIIVADPGAFSGQGGLITVDPTTGAQAPFAHGGLMVQPAGVAVARDGTVLVSDLAAFGNGGLIALDTVTGRQRVVSASTEFFRPMGIVFDSSGQLLVAYLSRFDGAGTVMRVDPSSGEHHAVAPEVRFASPAGVTVSQDGTVFVTDVDGGGSSSRLHRIAVGGTGVVLATDVPAGAIYGGIAMEGNGRLLVTDNCNPPPTSVLSFDPGTGAMTTVTQGDSIVDPFGVVVEDSGAILVSDGASGVIRIDPATGAQTTLAGRGLLATPLLLTVAP